MREGRSEEVEGTRKKEVERLREEKEGEESKGGKQLWEGEITKEMNGRKK